MIKKIKYFLASIVFLSSLATYWQSDANGKKVFDLPAMAYFNSIQPDTTTQESALPFPFSDKTGDPNRDKNTDSPLFLDDPQNATTEVEYDPESGEYIFRNRIGNFEYRPPVRMSLDEYSEYQLEQTKREYWQQKARSSEFNESRSFVPSFQIQNEAFDKVFGSNTINITPQGSAEVIFGFTMNRLDNPQLSERLRRTPSFTFKEKIQMNVAGSIGDKMELGINYNTEATFDFENKTKLEYVGEEDEIIKKIEAGNVTLPLSGSLITGSQSLFGLKTELQFGKLTMTSVFSHQKGESSVIDVEGGSQVDDFEISAGDYDANRHFFLSHYFRQQYDNAMSGLPVIRSNIQVEDLEVWVTNKTLKPEGARNIVAFVDLGEKGENITNANLQVTDQSPYPNNNTNELYPLVTEQYNIRDIGQVTSELEGRNGFIIGRDYEKIENARLLDSREYTLNRTLGYISLNTALNADEVLAVAYRYKVVGSEDYQKVGELTNNAPSSPQTIVVKLLKGTNLTPRYKTWDLMMKNIYAINAYQVNKADFMLNVLYQDDNRGQSVNYIPGGRTGEDILLRVFGLDRLNNQNDPYPDGLFDFLPGVTIIQNSGRIIFPMVQPFGNYLEDYLQGTGMPADSVGNFVFKALYDSTKTKALQVAEKNKFVLSGEYKSSSGSEIQLNALNVPRGSVKVTAGGIQLTENVDYTVDYTLGRVKIINQGLMESGTPVRISLESNTMFNMQTKTLVGTNLNYKFNDDFYVGGTILNLTERPLTKKVNFGDEPISNTIWGVNGAYRTESPFITSLVDKIPFIDTKEKSMITVDGEFAHLIPGSSRAIGKSGIAYIDDFEGSETSIDMKSFPAWVLSSTPQGQDDKFPEANLNNNLAYGFNRAKLAWYVIDDLFQENTSLTPSHIKSNAQLQSSHLVRTVLEQEIFPNRESEHNIPNRIAVLNLSYYPTEKGPYNFDVDGTDRLGNRYAAGINEDGTLAQPETRWGGIMREVITSDFETANIEFIEFWMMDPYAEDTLAYETPGYLGDDPAIFFNLGNVSEDILKDSRKAFENGLPTPDLGAPIDTTEWGVVSRAQDYTTAFDTDLESRQYQDLGLDGLNSEQERQFYRDDYLDKIAQLHGQNSSAFIQAFNDPSNDDFHYYRGTDYDDQQLGILERYKAYNGLENNSRTAEQSPETYSTTGRNSPDIEDINRDNTLSEAESYFQYKVSLRPEMLNNVGQNYITDIIEHNAKFKNGDRSKVRWLQFKVPLEDFERSVGPIDDFKSIRFMRLFMHGIEKEVVLRFATLDLVRSEWRKYNLPLYESIEYVEDQNERGSLDVSAVNIEENANKQPVNYVLPPGFDREIDPSNPQIRQLNEQAMVLRVNDLSDGDARAAYKNLELDLRQYKKLQMEIHAEELSDGPALEDGDLTVFVRIGSDYVNNFYEYEVPLKITPPGNYSNSNEQDRELVWPESNSMEIDLELLTRAKMERNDARRMSNSTVNLTTIYEYWDGENRVLVRGNPNLSNIRTIMLGVRNPKRSNNLKPENDGYPKSGEIWVNELRLTNFRDRGGWAANTRIKANLADFGVVSFAGAISTPGFGSIEQKVNERHKEETVQYDVATNLELGKFFPEKAGVSIPLYLGYSETNVTPEFDPLDPDIPLKESLSQAASDAQKDEILEVAVDKTVRKSLNLTNVKINKSSTQKKIYDPSNFAVSYSYSEKNHQDINVQSERDLNYRAAFSYNYSSRPENVTPLSKVKLLSNPYLRLVRDFNFYYLPSRISFRTDLNRQYSERQFRNLGSFGGEGNVDLKMPTMVFKDYTWNRYYDFKFDLTKSLKLDFSATNIARFDESIDPMDRFGVGFRYDPNPEFDKEFEFGRTLNYRHNIRASYAVPINKIPMFSWTSLTVQYDGSYNWQAGPLKLEGVEDSSPLGNTISNSAGISINSSNRLSTLYTKVGYFKRLEQKYNGRGQREQPKEMKTIIYERERVIFNENTPRSINHKLKTEDIKVIVSDESGAEIDADYEIVDEDKISITLPEDMRGVKVRVEGQVEKKPNPLIFIAEQGARMLIGLKDISGSYRETRGMVLPGYLNNTSILGNDRVGGLIAPGPQFVLGMQQNDFLDRAQQNGWISQNEYQLSPINQNLSTNYEVRSTYEPFKGFRITLNANRTYTEIYSQNYGPLDDAASRFGFYGTMKSGSYSMSTITWGTAFEDITTENNYKSQAFENFKEYRQVVSSRLSEKLQDKNSNYDPRGGDFEPGYALGYGSTSKEVLLPAFLSAYTGQSPEQITLKKFPEIPMPNWRLTFDGLSKIEFVQKYLRSINITHSYRSRYNIGSFASNLDYGEDDFGLPFIDLQNNFLSPLEINSVSIEEQLSPLIGFDMNWHNSLTSRFEIKKSRSIGLNFANNQLIELNNNELVIGAGYSIKDVELVINAGSGQQAYNSDLNLRADLSIRDSKTIIRYLSPNPEERTSNLEITAGERRVTIKTTMDYQLSDSFNVSFFFDRVMNTPATSRSYPYANTNIGFSVRFTLIQ